MKHGEDAGFLAVRMEVKNVMMLATTDQHTWIVDGELTWDASPLRDALKRCRQQAAIASLLPWPPLPQRIAGNLAQVTFSIRRQFIR